METNIRVRYSGFELHIGYTLAEVLQHYGTVTDYPLVARNRVNNTLMYEIEDKIKVGLEAYYYSPQRLSDGTTGRDYWLCGMMVEKMWAHFSIFVNVEDLLDVRQTQFGPIYTGTINNPVFKDIYAPLDGRVVNGGIKWRL
jgi:iron complex outermembrane receptor protein